MLDIVAWARRFIATPSVSRGGNEAIGKLAARMLAEVGIEAVLIPATHEGVRHFTVMAELGPKPSEASQGLLMLTHLDTVPPGDAGLWTETGGNPYCPTERDGLLYGLGSADAKVDFVCKAAALAEIDARTLCRPLRLIGSFAEEIGLVGARWLVDAGETSGFVHALVGEPSELCAIRAHKGYAVFEARIPLPRAHAGGHERAEEIEGQSAHSSTPQLGRNAIDLALARLAHPQVLGVTRLEGGGAVNQVPARCSLGTVGSKTTGAGDAYDPKPLLAFHAAWRELLAGLAEHKDPDFDPDCSVGNLGRVRLEDGVAVLGFDLRSVPGSDPQEAVASLAEVAEIRCLRTNPPLGTDPDTDLVRAVVKAQQTLDLGERVGTKATCTEAGLLQQAGLDAVVIGAGTSVGNVHRPNEHTRLAELGTARDLYREVVRSLCVEAA